MFNDFQQPLIRAACLDTLPAFAVAGGARQDDPNFVQNNLQGYAVGYYFMGASADGKSVETTISTLRDASGSATAYGCETK